MALLSELALIFILFVFNGVFAMAELAVVSAKRTRLQQMAQRGDAGAQAAVALAEEPTSFLSTVQIGITLIGILAGAIGGATLSSEFAAIFAAIPFLAGSATALGFASTVLVTTYLSLVVGELVPKRLALSNPELVASRIARPMGLLSVITQPAVKLLTLSTNAVLKLMRVRADQSSAVTEEDLVAMLRESAGTGELEPAESELVERALRLDDIWLGQVMTPYPDIMWLDIRDDRQELRQKLHENGHSRYPVIDGSTDKTLGIVRTQDILHQLLDAEHDGGQIDLHSILHPPQYLPISTTPVDALNFFRTNEVHVALLIDEYSNIKGLITPMDILEAIVGDLSSIPGQEDDEIFRREDGSLLIDGTVHIDELLELLNISEEIGNGLGSFRTLGGLVMAELGRVPQVGDRFEWEGYELEVVDMDNRRVDRVLVRQVTVEPDNEE
jgi:putative hemolysin